MKKLFLLFFVFVIANNIQAQLLKKLKDKVETKVENKAKSEKKAAENKVDTKIDNTIDNAVDTVKKAVTGGNSKTEKTTTGGGTTTEPTKTEKPKPATTSKPATSSNPAKKMTSQEKELYEAYLQQKHKPFTGEVPNADGLIYPTFGLNGNKLEYTDENNNGYMSRVISEKGAAGKQTVHYYKIDNNLKATPFISFVGDKYDGTGKLVPPGELGNRCFISNSSNIYYFKGLRNGSVLYKVSPDGEQTAIAGNPESYKTISDGNGSTAKFGDPIFVKDFPDGSILFLDQKPYDGKHENFPDFPEDRKSNLWRIITPDGEIKTLTDAQGKPLSQRIYSNILTDKDGYWYFSNDYDIIRFKPGNNIQFETFAKTAARQKSSGETAMKGTWWAMGPLGKANFPGIAKMCWGPNGEIYFFSITAKRFAVLKNKTVSHVTGTSDFSAWYAGNSLGAQCGSTGFSNAYEEKDGSATTTVICDILSMRWLNGQLLLLKKAMIPDPNSKGYYLPSFKFINIDKNGNSKSMPVSQNINQ